MYHAGLVEVNLGRKLTTPVSVDELINALITAKREAFQ